MTREEVLARLGTPNGESHFGSFTYLFYENGCVVKCGVDDVVVVGPEHRDGRGLSVPQAHLHRCECPRDLAAVGVNGLFRPTPLRLATREDSAHPGGIVFARPHAVAQPPRYIRIVPNRADSARMASPRSVACRPESGGFHHGSALTVTTAARGPQARPGDPAVTPALVAEHGLTSDEYDAHGADAGARADVHRAGDRQRALERALLVQALTATAQDTAHHRPVHPAGAG